MFTYKCVPAPQVLLVNSQKKLGSAISEFASLINQEAIDGWEFHSMESISTHIKGGCLGGNGTTQTYNMLVFKKLKE